jgi:hypothetical protein
MSIPFKCHCGRRMKVKDSKAGKKVRCPNCGHGVRVPVAAPNTDDQIKALKDWVKDTDQAQRDAGRATPSPATKSHRVDHGSSPLTATPPPKNKTLKKVHEEPKVTREFPWLYVAGLGAVIVLGGLVWLIFLR